MGALQPGTGPDRTEERRRCAPGYRCPPQPGLARLGAACESRPQGRQNPLELQLNVSRMSPAFSPSPRPLGLGLLLAAIASLAHAADPVRRPNVLLICVDDLKPTIGAYGDVMAKTPHLDRLAARGTRF